MSVKRGCSVVARDGMGASEARSEEGSFGKAGVCICWTPSSSSGTWSEGQACLVYETFIFHGLSGCLRL